MNSKLIPTYFSSAELEEMKQKEGKILQKVDYMVWKNVANPNNPYEALDGILLHFEDGKRLGFVPNEDQDGIRINDFNFALEQSKVLQQFSGQVELFLVDMSESPVWEKGLGQTLNSVGLMSPLDGYFQNDVIQLEFSEHSIEISLGEEGLLAYPPTGM